LSRQRWRGGFRCPRCGGPSRGYLSVLWVHECAQCGYQCSVAGFFLPDGSMLSPNAAYILPEQLEELTEVQLTVCPHRCPAFVIELLSTANKLAQTQEKMGLWIANGSQLGWLVDPYQQQVLVYVPGSQPHAVEHTARG